MSGRIAGWGLALLASLACTGGSPARVAGGAPPRANLRSTGGAVVPAGESLAFFVQDGDLRSYFARQGASAAHVLARSGLAPRLIVAFPAGNAGIGVWFEPLAERAELWFGAAPDGTGDGDVTPIERAARGEVLRGICGRLHGTAQRLSSELVLLGSVRTLRDYGYGECLEDASRFPALRNETLELSPEGDVLRVRREAIGGSHAFELLLAAQPGTRLRLLPRQAAPRAACPLPAGAGQPIIEISGEQGIELELCALASDEPLTPIAARDLFAADVPPSTERSALEFLSYEEKLLAGSWRFLTYFGRDTLLSLWLLAPVLADHALEAGVGAVLERVQLAEGVAAPGGGTLDRGDVAHEEEIGDYAAWKNRALDPPPRDLRRPRYDYAMIDDDFLLAPLLVALDDGLGGVPFALSTRARADAPARAATPLSAALGAFLERRRPDGARYVDAVLANLDLVLQRARPFADDPAPPSEKKRRLVALRPGLSVGQWRDSAAGLGFGRFPFDVNVALVPAALAAAETLYTRLGEPARAAEARRVAGAWQGVEALFRIELDVTEARRRVQRHAAALGLVDPSSEIEPGAAGQVVDYGIALTGAGEPIPVMHSDHGFVLAFARPSEAYLRDVAKILVRTFPAGLSSAVGMLVANPALAPAEQRARDPNARAGAAASTPLRELFTPEHYHGSVVWSWQQALMAAGLGRQLARTDLTTATRAALERAQCASWRAIEATRAMRSRELWSWTPGADGIPRPRPFGAARADADEANAIQLWSSVYLALERPAPASDRACAAAGVSR